MNNLQNAVNHADKIAENMVAFWAAFAGKGINQLEEFSMLVEWYEAAEAARNTALAARCWKTVDDFDAVIDEVNSYFDINGITIH